LNAKYKDPTFSFQAAVLIDDVMIAPSFNRNTVRGFWPGLGAKSWASVDMATNQSDRCCSLASFQV
jgi:hypothetical protein